jgi:hypothetical protein
VKRKTSAAITVDAVSFGCCILHRLTQIIEVCMAIYLTRYTPRRCMLPIITDWLRSYMQHTRATAGVEFLHLKGFLPRPATRTRRLGPGAHGVQAQCLAIVVSDGQVVAIGYHTSA